MQRTKSRPLSLGPLGNTAHCPSPTGQVTPVPRLALASRLSGQASASCPASLCLPCGLGWPFPGAWTALLCVGRVSLRENLPGGGEMGSVRGLGASQLEDRQGQGSLRGPHP